MKKGGLLLIMVFVVSAIAVGATTVVAVYKTKFKKKYITVCD